MASHHPRSPLSSSTTDSGHEASLADGDGDRRRLPRGGPRGEGGIRPSLLRRVASNTTTTHHDGDDVCCHTEQAMEATTDDDEETSWTSDGGSHSDDDDDARAAAVSGRPPDTTTSRAAGHHHRRRCNGGGGNACLSSPSGSVKPHWLFSNDVLYLKKKLKELSSQNRFLRQSWSDMTTASSIAATVTAEGHSSSPRRPPTTHLPAMGDADEATTGEKERRGAESEIHGPNGTPWDAARDPGAEGNDDGRRNLPFDAITSLASPSPTVREITKSMSTSDVAAPAVGVEPSLGFVVVPPLPPPPPSAVASPSCSLKEEEEESAPLPLLRTTANGNIERRIDQANAGPSAPSSEVRPPPNLIGRSPPVAAVTEGSGTLAVGMLSKGSRAHASSRVTRVAQKAISGGKTGGFSSSVGGGDQGSSGISASLSSLGRYAATTQNSDPCRRRGSPMIQVGRRAGSVKHALECASLQRDCAFLAGVLKELQGAATATGPPAMNGQPSGTRRGVSEGPSLGGPPRNGRGYFKSLASVRAHAWQDGSEEVSLSHGEGIFEQLDRLESVLSRRFRRSSANAAAAIPSSSSATPPPPPDATPIRHHEGWDANASGSSNMTGRRENRRHRAVRMSSTAALDAFSPIGVMPPPPDGVSPASWRTFLEVPTASPPSVPPPHHAQDDDAYDHRQEGGAKEDDPSISSGAAACHRASATMPEGRRGLVASSKADAVSDKTTWLFAATAAPSTPAPPRPNASAAGTSATFARQQTRVASLLEFVCALLAKQSESVSYLLRRRSGCSVAAAVVGQHHHRASAPTATAAVAVIDRGTDAPRPAAVALSRPSGGGGLEEPRMGGGGGGGDDGPYEENGRRGFEMGRQQRRGMDGGFAAPLRMADRSTAAMVPWLEDRGAAMEGLRAAATGCGAVPSSHRATQTDSLPITRVASTSPAPTPVRHAACDPISAPATRTVGTSAVVAPPAMHVAQSQTPSSWAPTGAAQEQPPSASLASTRLPEAARDRGDSHDACVGTDTNGAAANASSPSPPFELREPRDVPKHPTTTVCRTCESLRADVARLSSLWRRGRAAFMDALACEKDVSARLRDRLDESLALMLSISASSHVSLGDSSVVAGGGDAQPPPAEGRRPHPASSGDGTFDVPFAHATLVGEAAMPKYWKDNSTVALIRPVDLSDPDGARTAAVGEGQDAAIPRRGGGTSILAERGDAFPTSSPPRTFLVLSTKQQGVKLLPTTVSSSHGSSGRRHDGDDETPPPFRVAAASAAASFSIPSESHNDEDPRERASPSVTDTFNAEGLDDDDDVTASAIVVPAILAEGSRSPPQQPDDALAAAVPTAGSQAPPRPQEWGENISVGEGHPSPSSHHRRAGSSRLPQLRDESNLSRSGRGAEARAVKRGGGGGGAPSAPLSATIDAGSVALPSAAAAAAGPAAASGGGQVMATLHRPTGGSSIVVPIGGRTLRSASTESRSGPRRVAPRPHH